MSDVPLSAEDLRARMPDHRVTAIPPLPTEPNPHLSGLAVGLYRASRDNARLALHRYVSDERADRLSAAMAVGASIEYLLRAIIATRDPLLLADRSSIPSLVMLSRANAASPLDLRRLRTLKFAELLNLFYEMFPNSLSRDSFQMVMTVRNAAAHAAMVDDALLTDAVQKLVVMVDAVLVHINHDAAEFWGPGLASLAAEMQQSYRNAISIRVESKVAYARVQLELIVGDLGPPKESRLWLRSRLAWFATPRLTTIEMSQPRVQRATRQAGQPIFPRETTRSRRMSLIIRTARSTLRTQLLSTFGPRCFNAPSAVCTLTARSCHVSTYRPNFQRTMRKSPTRLRAMSPIPISSRWSWSIAGELKVQC